MSSTKEDKIRKYELVIFGATGFTGKIASQYIDTNYPYLKWAIAGRNYDKLGTVQKSCINTNPDILIGEADNSEQLGMIASSTKVILSFAGPFNKYSNLLVEKCIDEDTNYIDITGENIWVKDLIDKFHSKAVEKNIKIIPSCGYDSIPSDIGTFFTQRCLNKKIVSIDCYQSGKGGVSGGTIESGFSMMEYETKNKIGHTFLLNPKDSYSDIQKEYSKDKFSIKRNKYTNSWSAPFIMAPANTRVVRRSASLLELKQNGYGDNFVYNEYMDVKSYKTALLIASSLAIFGAILSLPFRRVFRPLLIKPGNGPSKKVQDNGWFKSIFITKTSDKKTYISKMYGDGDPGYKSTARFACESALSIIENQDKLEYKDGGVLTSATGLGQVLIDRLKVRGVTFEDPIEI